MAKDKRPTPTLENKVIHVAFGHGGGRIAPPADTEPAAEPSRHEPVADVYTQAEVAKLLDLPRGRLRSLDKAGIVKPTGRRKGRRAYTFSDIIALRTARELLRNKVRLREVGRAIAALRDTLPRVAKPLNELRIASDGKQVIVRTSEGTFQPVTGQMVLDFEVRQLHADVVRVLRPRSGRDRAHKAYELYLKASQIDENPDTMDEAERIYRQALKHDPWLAIVYTNLGNIRFRRGDEEQAAEMYHRALAIESTQPEAKYNLGYMMLHRGKLEEAIRYFRGALSSDGNFADAFFNLAMAYEQVGDVAAARGCWKEYLEREPIGTWADIARQHLGQF